MKCAEIMTLNPKVCTPEESVSVAVNLMWDCDCGAIPVVKDIESREPVGMITDRDIAMHVAKHGYKHPAEAKVGDCMSTPAVFCLPDEPLEKAIQLMGENKIRRILIVDPNVGCVGLLSQTDLLLRVDNPELVFGALRKISAPHSESKAEAESSEAKVESKEEAPADNDKKKPKG